MNIKFFNQPKDVSLESLLNTKLKGDFKKIWIIAGMTKDSGMDMVFDSIEIARKNGAEVNIMIGIDRKNTSKDMLMKLLNMGCNLFVHINREDKKIETRIYVFENEDGESFVYESCGKFSEGGLSSNYCLIQEISYLPEDKKTYENFKTVLMQGALEVFKKVGAEEIKLLAEKGEIVTRIIDRKIPRISELYGSGSVLGNENVADTDIYDENNGKKLFDINLDDDEKSELHEFLTGFDNAGNSWLGKALNDPNTLVKLGYYALNGDRMIEEISSYYNNEIAQVRQNSYKKGYEDAKKES